MLFKAAQLLSIATFLLYVTEINAKSKNMSLF